MKSVRLFATIALACAIPLAALYASVGSRAPTTTELQWTDLPWYFTPTFAVLHRALAEGFFPLWNPWQLAGWPFLAAFQTQVLYAPAWAVAWLEPHLAVTAYSALHWAWMFAGMSALATTLGLAAPAAISAAVLFTLCGPNVNLFFAHAAGLAACSWLPWAALAAVRAAGRRDLRSIALVAFVLAMTLLAGAPEHFFYLAIAVVVVGTTQAAAEPFALARRAAAIAAGFAIAALVAAAQIVPTIELMQHAVRSADTFDAQYIARFQAPTANVIRGATGLGGGPGHLTHLMLPLALAALAFRATRVRALVLLLTGVLVLDHLRGMNGFVFPFAFEWVPFVKAFRTQLRAEFVWSFFAAIVAAIVAAYGVDAVARWRPGNRMLRAASVAIAAALVVEAGARALPNHVFVVLQDPQLLYGTPDLRTALAEAPGPERMFVHYGSPGAGLHHKFGQMHGVLDVAEYDALVPASYARLFRMPTNKPWMGRLQFQSRTKNYGFRSVDVPGVELETLDLLSARYYFARAGSSTDWLESHVGGVTRYRGDYVVVERAAARPRAYVVHHVVAAATRDDALERLRAAGFDAATTAVVTGEAPMLEARVPGADEPARVSMDSPNAVTIDATCASRCLLVLTDLDYPGWKAAVDGRDAPILTANALLRGVVLEAGTHRVAFRYRPASVMAGAGISLVTLLVLALAVGRRAARASTRDAQ